MIQVNKIEIWINLKSLNNIVKSKLDFNNKEKHMIHNLNSL